RHVRRRAARALTRLLQRDHLGVWPSGHLVPRLAHDPVAAHEHAAHDRIRMCRAAPALGKLERAFETHVRACSRRRYARGRSSMPKIELPATNSIAPAMYASVIVSTPIPPSTRMGLSSERIARAPRMRPRASGLNPRP